MKEQVAEEVRNRFVQAIEHGHCETVADLCAQHPELQAAIDQPWFSFGTPAIVLMAGRGNRQMVEVLLEAGADINVKSDWQPGPYSALHHVSYGAQKLDLEMAEFLISRGAEIDVHAAAGLGRLDLLQQMLEQNPQLVDQRGPDGQMPLSVARNPEVAACLIEHGAAVDSRCLDHNSTPAQYCAHNRPEVTRFLLQKGAKADVFMAVALGDLELLQKLLGEDVEKAKLRIDETTCGFESPTEGGNIYCFTLGNNGSLLHAAAHANQPAMVQPLLEAGVDIDVRGDYDDCTALHIAAWEDHSEVGRELLRHGATIDIESGELHQNTPLGWAIVSGSVAMAQVLLETGAEIREYYLRDTHEGEAGTFRPYAPRASVDDYRAIRTLLEATS